MAQAATVAGTIGGRRQRVERLVSERLADAFRAEELAGLKLATRAKLIALVVIAFWLFVWVPPPRVFFLETILALFALCALLHYRLTSRAGHAAPTAYVFGAIDMALLTFSMVGYDLLIGDDPWPAQMMLRNGTFVYFLLFLALVALSYSSRLVLWCGACGALSWTIGVGLIVGQTGTLTSRELEAGMNAQQRLAIVLNPRYVDLDVIVQDIVVLLLVAGVLAAGARRSRRLVLREAVAARERTNLARYFSPRIVDQLAQADEPLAQVRAQPVAVLFADIVGFTRLSEREAPERIVALLRDFHARLEQAVFEHDGTLDKYLGDGVMATFGTPDAGPGDALNALTAARAMLADIAAWNRERARAGETAVRLSIGIHYGEVVLGDIGSERRLEFAVIGDVVNVASRLESLTRELGSPLVVSDALVAAARANPKGALALAGLRPAEPQRLRGRDQPVAVWALDAAESERMTRALQQP
jgi:adenylate cyclase